MKMLFMNQYRNMKDNALLTFIVNYIISLTVIMTFIDIYYKFNQNPAEYQSACRAIARQ